METVLKTLVGSHAHGLARPDSDMDYRGVFVVRTSDLLRLGGSTKTTSWIEGNEDDTNYEIGHFLHLATKSNPSILEVFKAPVVEATEEGLALRDLFPYVWSSKGVHDAFVGYSLNQRKKMLSDDEQYSVRRWKYAVAYIRVLINGIDLLRTGDFSVEVADPDFREALLAVRRGELRIGSVVDFAEGLKEDLAQAYEHNASKKTDEEKINEFLLKIRKENW